MEFSPPKRPPKPRPREEEKEKAVLVLKPFAAVPCVSFNKVKLGTSKCCDLYVYNPLDVRQTVKVEKVPSEKGFFVEEQEFSVNPGEERILKIFWAPEKESSCRETIVFKSSTGCKTHATLHGVACSPQIQKSQKTVKKKQVKSNNVPKSSAASSNTSKICEGKEDLDFAAFQREPFANITEKSNFEFVQPLSSAGFQPRPSFTLREDNVCPDSPIRRQTYTINSLFSNVRKSEVLPLPPKESLSQKTDSVWDRHQPQFALNDRKLSFASEFDFPPPFSRKFPNQITQKKTFLMNEEKEEDSLPNLNDSLSEAVAFLSDKTFDGIVETHHIENGDMPLRDIEKPKTSKSVGFYDERKAAYFISGNEKPCAISRPFNSRNQQSFDVGSFNESKIDGCNYSETLNDTDLPSFLQKKSFCKDLSDIDMSKELNFTEYPQRKGGTVSKTLPKSTVQDDVLQHLEIDIKKETKTSVYLQIPTSPFEISSCSSNSVCSKIKKHPKVTEHSKHVLKKNLKCSPYKAKTGQSKTLLNNTDHLPKITEVGVTEKSLTARMPRKLCLKKSRLSTSVVTHRNPFASRNTYYDEHWIAKQELAFTAWMNFILTPNDDFNGEDVKVDSAKLWIESIKENACVPAPTKEQLSLAEYTAARNLWNLRKSALSLFQSEVTVIKNIEREVDLKKISVRKDRAIHADLGIRKDILEMMLSYNPLWLRIGLETVYGEVIALQSNSDVLGLSRFIVHRFLQNPDIAAKYLHPGVINYFRKGYEDTLARFILKKFLLMVYFLDLAKNQHLIKHNPCLFNKNAKFKASRDLLLEFSKEYLSGEGDFTKHLRYLGYKVSYHQTALEEFDYSVRNLSTDLRCGLRLGRVVEILLQDWTISKKLRSNTLNRLAKIYNNDVILKALKDASIEIENNIEAKSITDGNREKTLDLLWQIIFKIQVSKMIDKELLKKENSFLSKSLKLKSDFAAYNILRNPECSLEKQENLLDSKLYKENETLQLLFQWCQNVCALYGVRVYNFTSSFSDGRVLCLLLYHYLPNILPYESIKFETSVSHYEKLSEDSESCPVLGKNGSADAVIEKLLQNEKENLQLVFQKFQEVGHIPILSQPSDMFNTWPDEKVMITLVAYINKRLMELSLEIRAARLLLHTWRRYKLRQQYRKLEAEIMAAIKIQRALRKYLANKKRKAEEYAVLKIQAVWRSYSAKKKLRSLKESRNAVIIQSAVRRFLVRKHILKSHQAATVIQTHIRKWIARSHYLRLRNAAIQIQQRYRAKKRAQIQRHLYVTTHQKVVKLQAYARGFLARKQFHKLQNSVLKIQSWIRMCLMRKKYIKMQNACIIIQQRFRAYRLTRIYREKYQNYRSSAILIQRWYRIVKQQQYKLKCIVKIQANVRRFIARKNYLKICQSAIKIQSWWRAVSAQLFYKKARKSIICIQSFIRQRIASKKYKRQKEAAICIQKNIRAFRDRKRFQKMKASVTYVQNAWRLKCLTRKTRTEYLSLRKNAILIQSVFRGWIAVRSFNQKRNAAIAIQKNIRALLLRKKYLQLKCNAVLIQRKWRATLLAREIRGSYLHYKKCVILAQSVIRRQIAYYKFKKMRQSAIIIQKYSRMLILRRQFLNSRKSSILVQSWWRNILYGRKLRQNFLKFRKAAIVIQSWYRMHSHKEKYSLLKKAVATVERYRKGKVQRERYLKIKQSVLKLQSIIRSYLCRKQYLKTVKSVVFVQACARRLICRKKFLKAKESVIKLQRFYQAYKAMCIDRQIFLKIKVGVCRLQAVYRGRVVRKNIQLLHEKATVIQKYYKKWKAQSDYKKLRHSCLIVQRKFRAKLEMQQQYYQFMKIKNSVIKIQAFVRCHKARKQYNSLRSSVIKLQSCVRMIRCFKRYQTMKKAATTIQQYYRSYHQMKITRSAFVHKRSMVILLQSKVRSLIARKKFLKLKKACIVIQSSYRMYSCQKKYKEKQNAALVLQRFYRSWKLTKQQQNIYNQERKLIIFLQSKCRSVLARKNFIRKRNACIYIQSCCRRYLARKKYKEKQNAALVLQRFYRSWKLTKQQQNIYNRERKLIIFLQSKCRSVIARKNFIRKRNACIYIQSCCRRYLARKKYKEKRNAALVLQRFYRSWKLTKQQQNIYNRERKLIIFLQSKCRSVKARKNFIRKRNACIYIQSCCRRYLARKKYKEKRNAALVLQRFYRSWKLTKQQQNIYNRERKLIIFLQSKCRSVIARKNFIRKRNACIYIQSCCRRYLARKKYKEKRNAALVLQRFYRSWKLTKQQQNIYNRERKLIIFLQSKWRSVIARKNFIRKRNACIYIQSCCRRYMARKKYKEKRNAALVLQRFYRSWKLTKQQQNIYNRERKLIIFLQSKWRSVMARKNFIRKRNACIFIQSCCRRYLARKKYMEVCKAAVFIQRFYRNYCLTKDVREQYVYTRRCIITIQAFVKGYLVRKKMQKLHEAATKIQATYRSHVQQQNFSIQRKACICIQSYFRMYLERKKYNEIRKAAVFLQRYYRNRRLSQRIRQQYLHMKKSSILIQACIRGFLVRQNIRKLHESATKIQAVYRSHVQQKNFVKQKNSCIYIQSYFRMYVERKKYLKVHEAAVTLQKYYRNRCLSRKLNQQYIYTRKCIITIQSFVRGYLVRKHLRKLHISATKIQAIYKSYSLRKKFLKQRECAIVIQRHYKSVILTRKIHNEYKTLKSSAIIIQSAFRGHRERKKFLVKKAAATLIQANARMFIARKKLLKMKQSVCTIEKYYVAYKAALREHELYHLKRSSCIKIQAAWRGYLTRKKLKSWPEAAVRIQHAFRLWQQKKLYSNMTTLLQHKERLSEALFQHLWYLNLRKSTIAFQRAARAYLCKRIEAAIKIQACWRAYSVRRSITSKNILEARKRIENANSLESKKLKNRVEDSLQLVMFHGSSIPKMLQALEDLDVCTNLSPKCCERLASSNALTILVSLIQVCNRSIPHVEIIKRTTSILLNLAKYQKTTDYVWAELHSDALKPILQLMRTYREKGPTIFTKCASLLWIFCQDPDKAKEMKMNGKFVEEIRSFHYLVSRKQSLEENRLKKILSKSSMSSGSVKAACSRSRPDSFWIEPDWMLGHQRRREFKNPLCALRAIIDILDITPK